MRQVWLAVKYHNINEFDERSFYSKQNDLNEFKNKFLILKKLSQTINLRKKYLEKKVVIDTASKSCDNLLNIYATRYDKFSENLKKRINVLNKPDMLILHFDRGDLPPVPAVEDDEEVNVEPEETIAERKKNPQKKEKKTGTG